MKNLEIKMKITESEVSRIQRLARAMQQKVYGQDQEIELSDYDFEIICKACFLRGIRESEDYLHI